MVRAQAVPPLVEYAGDKTGRELADRTRAAGQKKKVLLCNTSYICAVRGTTQRLLACDTSLVATSSTTGSVIHSPPVRTSSRDRGCHISSCSSNKQQTAVFSITLFYDLVFFCQGDNLNICTIVLRKLRCKAVGRRSSRSFTQMTER